MYLHSISIEYITEIDIRNFTDLKYIINAILKKKVRYKPLKIQLKCFKRFDTHNQLRKIIKLIIDFKCIISERNAIEVIDVLNTDSS